MPKSRKKRKSPKRVLALPDLEQAKSAVLNTLTSKSGQSLSSKNQSMRNNRSVNKAAFSRGVVEFPIS